MQRPPALPAPQLDLGAKQRLIVEQIQQDQQRLIELAQEQEQLQARINANRGKLDLIAEIAQELRTQEQKETPPHDTATP